jgi:NAD(P)-dependent dehydrogenase (short-subunit alcohol dehydrogenase family)
MAAERRMDGKRVLVTGAGTGIGRGVALEFAREGAAVALHYSHSGSGAESAVQEILGSGGKAKAFKADFTAIEPVRQLARDAVGFLGGLDVLINNAGITMNMPFEQVTPEQFDTLYNVNVRAQFFLTQALVPALAERGKGSVINLTSVHAFAGMTEHSVYAGTKGAIVAYTRELSLELIQKGIRMNAIAPGWIFVENHRKVLGDQFDTTAAGKTIPSGFLGAPRDIGQLAVFLASDEARFMVGQTLIIDGGMLAIMPTTGDFRVKRPEQWGAGYVAGLGQG